MEATNQQPAQMPAPKNIFEAINLNVYNVSTDLHKLMDVVYEMQRELADARREVAELRAIFNPPAPEQPTAVPGDDGAKTEE